MCAAALWECLPVYLGCSTQRMTDGHLRHLSGPIVRTPYRTGPSARRVGSLPALLILLHVFTLRDGRRGEGCGFTAYGALIAPVGNPEPGSGFRSSESAGGSILPTKAAVENRNQHKYKILRINQESVKTGSVFVSNVFKRQQPPNAGAEPGDEA